jgi:hypothetical protein
MRDWLKHGITDCKNIGDAVEKINIEFHGLLEEHGIKL